MSRSDISFGHLPRGQRGAALFILLLLILVGAGTVFVSRLKSADVDLNSQRKTATALAEAKQALLGESVHDNFAVPPKLNPGRLLCADEDNSGTAPGSVCTNPYIGRIPWKTLGLVDVREGAGERLWYVVDNAFRSNGNPMNTTIWPTLTLNGRPVVAVIFAPGVALSMLHQDRATSGSPNPSLIYTNYLESFSASPSPAVATAPVSATFNDRLIGITPEELFTGVTLRIVKELAQSRGSPSYNPADGIAGLTPPATWTDNKWDLAVDYSSVTSSQIVIKFKHCAIVFTIAGPNTVALAPRSC